MRPVDPRLMQQAAAARTFLVSQVASGVVLAGLVIVQATLVAALIVHTFQDGAGVASQRGDLMLLAIVVLGRAALTWVGETSAYRSSAAVKAQLRSSLLTRARDLGPDWLARQPTGELTLLATEGLDALDDYFARYLPQLVLATLVPLIVGLRILIADPLSALVVVCTLPLIPVFMALIGMGTRDQMDKRWRTLGQLAHHFLDVLAGLTTLRVFGRAEAQVGTVRRVSEDLRRTTMKTLRVAFLSSFALELLSSLSVAVIAVSIGLRLVSGDLTLYTALVVLVLAPEVYLPWRRVGAAYHSSVEGLSAATRALDILDIPAPPVGADRSVRLPARIGIEGLSVTYSGRPLPALNRVSLRIEPGEVLAIVGPSGCGKSTLLSALMGFVTPSDGRISVGGIDLRDVDPRHWRAQVAWVGQRPHLFATTVGDNIRLGRPEASDDDVRHAAAMAGAADFIEELPLGYRTRLGERGLGLSAGQRQRIALARAFLKGAPLLLLDEPTAGLDADAEAQIASTLQLLKIGRTVVLTSHHPALFTRADRVLTLPLHSLSDATGLTELPAS
jgi:thiol reductant ABC exporter CydD subunit